MNLVDSVSRKELTRIKCSLYHDSFGLVVSSVLGLTLVFKYRFH
jgi:hypothetical protein